MKNNDALLPCPVDYCGLRTKDDDSYEFDLECRFKDGQKFSAISVIGEELANYIAWCINRQKTIREALNTRPQPSGDAVKALDAFNWLKSMGMISFNDTGFNKGVSVITYSEQLKLVEDFLNGKK